jgi:hypothetical protein
LSSLSIDAQEILNSEAEEQSVLDIQNASEESGKSEPWKAHLQSSVVLEDAVGTVECAAIVVDGPSVLQTIKVSACQHVIVVTALLCTDFQAFVSCQFSACYLPF